MEPIISIVVPVYNAENYLDACIQSVLEQSVECYELILVDDGSTDRSGVICDTWAMDDNRIKVIHCKNGGAAKARNIGVSEAKGNYITFIDADDTVTTDYVEYLYKSLCEYETDVAIGAYENIYPDETGKKLYEKDSEKNAMTGLEAMEKLLYQDGIMSVPWGMLIKKTILDKVKFPEGTKAEDMGTIYLILSCANRVVIGKHKVYNYYQRLNNTMFSTCSERNKDYYKHSRRMVKYIKNNYVEYLPAAYSRHFSTCFQILSETGFSMNNKAILKHCYDDIALLRMPVLNDKNARKQNRLAAMISMISVTFVHMLLLIFYKIKTNSMKNLERENRLDKSTR